MDNDYSVNWETIEETLRTADVIVIRFFVPPQRLLIDNRCSEIDPPLVKLVPKVNNPEERFRSLKQLRPRLRLPEKICSIWWPKYARTLVEGPFALIIRDRVAEAGFPGAVEQCDEAFRELVAIERAEVRKSIVGEGYRSIWSCERR